MQKQVVEPTPSDTPRGTTTSRLLQCNYGEMAASLPQGRIAGWLLNDTLVTISAFFFSIICRLSELEKPSTDNSHKELTCISSISLKANKPRHGTIWQGKWDGILRSKLIKLSSPDRRTPGRKEGPASTVCAVPWGAACPHTCPVPYSPFL